jgi:hypothetical protein
MANKEYPMTTSKAVKVSPFMYFESPSFPAKIGPEISLKAFPFCSNDTMNVNIQEQLIKQ